MPEYHQIQTTIPCEPSRFPELTQRYAEVLRRLGGSPALDAWFAQVRWEDGEVEAGFSPGPMVGFHLAGTEVTAAPCVISGGPDLYPPLQSTWIQLDLLFESASIEDGSRFPDEPRFEPSVARALWAVAKAVGGGFPGHAVFLTNEATDGEPWEGLVEDDAEKLWSFDLAVVPREMESRFAAVPPTHWSRREDGRLAFARRDAWIFPPWEDAG